MNRLTLLRNSRLFAHSVDALATARAALEQEFSWLGVEQPRVLELALNEAEAVAWETGFPELLFPALAEEKVAEVAEWHARQQRVQRVAPMLAFAA